MSTNAVTTLKNNIFPDVHWGPPDKPVLIADDRLFRIEELATPVEARSAYVVGVKQTSFEKLCRFLRCEILHFYEMRVSDLSPLTALKGLRQLAIRWNTKIQDITPLAQLRELQVLVFEDTPKVVDVSPIAACKALWAVEYSGGIWNKNSAATLAPLAELQALEELVLFNLKVQAGGLKPLAKCRRLKSLKLTNQFSTEDFAYLSVSLPRTKCEFFAPTIKLDEPIGAKDVLVVGWRKPLLNSRDDAARIEKYERAFAKLRAKFCAQL